MTFLTFSWTKVWWVISCDPARRAASCVGQLAVEQQVGDLEVGALLGELLDRVAAVAQDALVAVDEGDGDSARRGVHERRVVGHQPEVVVVDLDLAQVHRADGPVRDGDLVGLAGSVVGDGQAGVGAAGGRRGIGLLAAHVTGSSRWRDRWRAGRRRWPRPVVPAVCPLAAGPWGSGCRSAGPFRPPRSPAAPAGRQGHARTTAEHVARPGGHGDAPVEATPVTRAGVGPPDVGTGGVDRQRRRVRAVHRDQHRRRVGRAGVDGPAGDAGTVPGALDGVEGAQHAAGCRGGRRAAEQRVAAAGRDVDRVGTDPVRTRTDPEHPLVPVQRAVPGAGRGDVRTPGAGAQDGAEPAVDVDVHVRGRRGVGVDGPAADPQRSRLRRDAVQRAARLGGQREGRAAEQAVGGARAVVDAERAGRVPAGRGHRDRHGVAVRVAEAGYGAAPAPAASPAVAATAKAPSR